MNILVSDKWLRQWAKMKQKPEAFAAAISLVGPSVERIHRQGADLEKVVVGRIVSLAKHPNADKLRVAQVDVGNNENLNIVCGGSNLAENQLVAVAMIGARVRWGGKGDLATMEPAVIRGMTSEGMICGGSEVGLADRFPAKEEKEIIDLTSFGYDPGTPLAAALGLDDVVYDIEVTTNRPDALGIVGLAREACAATGGEFLWEDPKLPKLKAGGPKLKVDIKTKENCLRLQAALIEGITVGASPEWMQERLVSAGLRPINAVVDITNYVMLELGQPLHAFDEAAIPGRVITVRDAKEGEKIAALDGKEYVLKPGMMVLANDAGPIDIAGIIGGELSGTSERTKGIILVSACFSGLSVRRTGRTLNLRSDAAMRFEKNMPQGLTGPALARAVELVLQICGGKLAATADGIGRREKLPSVSISYESLNEKIGIKLAPPAVKKYLSSLGFAVTASAAKITAKVPYWRVGDVAIAEDLVEEVARLHGYGSLPAVLPPNLTGEAPDPVFAAEDRVRQALAAAGANDIVSISLVGPELLRQSGESEAPAVKIANPLSSDLDTLRPSHRARLLDAVRANEKSFSSGAVFEIGKVFAPSAEPADLPIESLSLGLLVWGAANDGGLFYRAKGLVEAAAGGIHAAVSFGRDFPKNSFWHPGRTASIHLGGAVIGTVGELTPDARAAAGTESRVAMAIIDFAELAKAAKPNATFRPLPSFPPVRRDVAFVIDRQAEHEFIVEAIKSADPLIASVELFDRYEGPGIDAGKKSLAYHLAYQAPDRTLTAVEAEAAHSKVVKMLEHKFKAVIRD